MTLLVSVHRGWKMIKPIQRPGMSFWQVKELELAAAVLIARCCWCLR